MRFVPISFAFVAFMLGCSGVNTEETERSKMTFLGERLLESLKNDNIIGYAQCWAPGAEIREMMRDPTDPKVSFEGEDIRELDDYYSRRDRLVARFFAPLRYGLEKVAGDLSRLSLESVSGNVEEQQGFRIVDEFEVLFRVDADTQVLLHMDDGLEVRGNWYFSNTPSRWIDIIRDGTAESLDVLELPVPEAKMKGIAPRGLGNESIEHEVR